MTHTPGKWTVIPDDQNFGKYTISGQDPEGARWQPIAITQRGNDTMHLKISEKQMLSNARLIAAAPDLLAALQDLQTQLHEHVKMDVKKHYSLMLADAAAGKAIAKATE